MKIAIPLLGLLFYLFGRADKNSTAPPQLAVDITSSHSDRISPDSTFDSSTFMVVRTRRAWTLDPIHPLLYFDRASSEIPPRYQTLQNAGSTERYRIDDLAFQSFGYADEVDLAKYHEILDIIGNRMRTDSSFGIELHPSHSTEPGETAEVAFARAEAVSHYLRSVWRIDRDRIKINSPVTGTLESDNHFMQEEARSVRISSSAPGLFAPLAYYHREISGETSYRVTVRLDPHAPHNEIKRMLLICRVGDSLLCRQWLPIPESDETFEWRGRWSPRLNENLPSDHLSFELLVHMKDGEIRRSNGVEVPMIIAGELGGTLGVEEGMTEIEVYRPRNLHLPFPRRESSIVDSIYDRLLDETAEIWREGLAADPDREWFAFLDLIDFETAETLDGGGSKCNEVMRELSAYARDTLIPLQGQDPRIQIGFSMPRGASRLYDSLRSQQEWWEMFGEIVSRRSSLVEEFCGCRSEREKKERSALLERRAATIRESLSKRVDLSKIDLHIGPVTTDLDRSIWLPEGRAYLRCALLPRRPSHLDQ